MDDKTWFPRLQKRVSRNEWSVIADRYNITPHIITSGHEVDLYIHGMQPEDGLVGSVHPNEGYRAGPRWDKIIALLQRRYPTSSDSEIKDNLVRALSYWVQNG